MNIPNSRLRVILLSFAMLSTIFLGQAAAVLPEEMLQDPKLEERARTISADLRCLVCQNQSIDDSNAPLAKDLRVIVRERLSAGDDDMQVVEFIVARYGNYVLLKPPLQSDTALLWLGPFLIMIASLVVTSIYFFRRPPLSEEEAVPNQIQSEKQDI
jgi:cytochrome c-type biogenesis protein CcmH